MSRECPKLGQILVCAECGGTRQESLEEIGWRWKITLAGWHAAAFREIQQSGTMIPFGYGIAYYVPGQDRCVVMPAPFHLIVGLWHAVRWWLMCPPWRFTGKLVDRAKELGREEGWDMAVRRYVRPAPGMGWPHYVPERFNG